MVRFWTGNKQPVWNFLAFLQRSFDQTFFILQLQYKEKNWQKLLTVSMTVIFTQSARGPTSTTLAFDLSSQNHIIIIIITHWLGTRKETLTLNYSNMFRSKKCYVFISLLLRGIERKKQKNYNNYLRVVNKQERISFS